MTTTDIHDLAAEVLLGHIDPDKVRERVADGPLPVGVSPVSAEEFAEAVRTATVTVHWPATDPTAPPVTPGETLDEAAITTRAEHYAGLCHQTGDSYAPDVVQAAHACADDVPPLLAELRRARAERDFAQELRDRAAAVREHDRRLAERAILHWAAERITDRLTVSPDVAAHAVAAWLNVWARDLDAARATDPAPATPPELYTVLVPGSASPDVDFCADAAEATNRAADLAAAEHPGYRAYRLVPLTAAPPAGTEPASATAVDPPAGAVTA